MLKVLDSNAVDTVIEGYSYYYRSFAGGMVTDNSVNTRFVGSGFQVSGTKTISASTSVTFNHGLAGAPTHVEVGWKDTGYGTWKWSATSTQITITVTNSGTYDFSWYAEYQP